MIHNSIAQNYFFTKGAQKYFSQRELNKTWEEPIESISLNKMPVIDVFGRWLLMLRINLLFDKYNVFET